MNPYPDTRTFSREREWHQSHLLNVPLSEIRLHFWPEQRRKGQVEYLIESIKSRGLVDPVSLVLMDEGFFAVKNGRGIALPHSKRCGAVTSGPWLSSLRAKSVRSASCWAVFVNRPRSFRELVR